MSVTRIYNQNQISLTLLASATVSSEQTAFPVSNAYNQQRRSKVWRSNGYWNIESGSNTIVFRESVGVDLTATVTAAEYSSTTTFIAAIKSALDTAGASTYTVSVDASTKKLKVVSDGAGGGGIFQIMWTDANSASMAGIMGFDTVLDDTGGLTYIADELKIHTEEWLKWDFGISSNPDAFVLIGKRNEPIQIGNNAVIKLQGNETDVWTSPSYEATLTYNTKVISTFKTNDSDDGLHTEGLRFWRLSIVDQDNPNGFVEIGALYLGDYLTFETGRVQTPLSGEYIDSSVTVFSEGGQSFSDEGPQSENFSLEWFPLNKADKDELDLFFDDFKTANPFFIQMDPGTAIGTTTTSYLRYVKMVNPPSWTIPFPGYFRVQWNLREEL